VPFHGKRPRQSPIQLPFAQPPRDHTRTSARKDAMLGDARLRLTRRCWCNNAPSAAHCDCTLYASYHEADTGKCRPQPMFRQLPVVTPPGLGGAQRRKQERFLVCHLLMQARIQTEEPSLLAQRRKQERFLVCHLLVRARIQSHSRVISRARARQLSCQTQCGSTGCKQVIAYEHYRVRKKRCNAFSVHALPLCAERLVPQTAWHASRFGKFTPASFVHQVQCVLRNICNKEVMPPSQGVFLGNFA
jgi:hypothetical protein